MIASPRGGEFWEGTRLVWIACAASLVLGLVFTFVRAPHPWRWNGFDHYNDLARDLARGAPYPTLDRIWGYPYFLAAFYRAFGERPAIPITVQVVLNALVPLLIYGEMRHRVDERTAVLSSLLVGVLSLSTVYASTQASEATCTLLYVGTVIAFWRSQRMPSAWRFAGAGLLAGLAVTVRPNLLVFPLFLVAVDLAMTSRRRQVGHLAAFAAAVIILWAPWAIRNARLTGRFIPATTHGGIVFWIASLQVGPYAENWTANPRAFLESGPFDYSLPGPVHVEATVYPGTGSPRAAGITYWTNRATEPVRVAAAPPIGDRLVWDLPGQPAGTVIHYYLDAEWPTPDGTRRQPTPVAGARDPLLHFITRDHFGDVDTRDELLDAFDVVRLVRHEIWNEPVRNAQALDLDRDGRLTRKDLDLSVGALVTPAAPLNRAVSGMVRDLLVDKGRAVLVLRDGSSLTVRQSFTGLLTDLDVEGVMAADMVRSQRSFASLALTPDQVPELATADAAHTLTPAVNKVFYRLEPLLQDRFNALAWANITREPGAFLVTSLRRVARLFVSVGSTDSDRAAQFRHSGVIYAASTAASVVQFVLFFAGVVLAFRRRLDVAMPLAAVAYVPATLFLFMTTARYLVIAQPFIFVFVAVALLALADAIFDRRLTQ